MRRWPGCKAGFPLPGGRSGSRRSGGSIPRRSPCKEMAKAASRVNADGRHRCGRLAVPGFRRATSGSGSASAASMARDGGSWG